MARFAIRTFRQELASMVDYVRARTEITALSDASLTKNLLGAVARRIEVAYTEIARLLLLYDINNAEGDDLDERAVEYMPDGFERRAAAYAVGTVRYTRALAGSQQTIPVGTVFSMGGIRYVTTGAGEFADGATVSQSVGGVGDIPSRAEAAGSAGNRSAGAATMVTTVPGTKKVEAPSDHRGGIDKESDDAFRARIRERTRTLSRCTKEALESRARDAALSNGRKILAATARKFLWNPGAVTVYVDDGAGTVESRANAAEEILIEDAFGGEKRLFARYGPLYGNAWTLTRTRAGVPTVLVDGTDYRVAPGLRLFELAEALEAGDKVTLGAYIYFTGLVAEAQRLIDGENDDADTPAWRAFGDVVRVLPAVVTWISVTVTVAVTDEVDRSVAKANVEAAIMDHINGLDIGEDVILNRLREKAMAVFGVYDVDFDAPSGNVWISEDGVARIQTSNLKVL